MENPQQNSKGEAPETIVEDQNPTVTEEKKPHNPTKNNLLIPLAIVIAGALIAGSLYLTRGATTSTSNRPKNTYPEKNLVAVTAQDHILGAPTAPIMLVEHSDTDCPYCQVFQEVLHGVITQYANTGKVAWVYRHFSFHPNAPKEAEATECVAQIGGNDKFWQYLDLIFSKKDFTKQPYKGLDPAQLPILAASIGVDKAAVTKCLADGTYKAKVAQQYQDTQKAGGSGTPFLIITSKAEINKETRKFVEDTNTRFLAQAPNNPDILYVSSDKHKIVMNGAMPADLLNQVIQLLIKNNN